MKKRSVHVICRDDLKSVFPSYPFVQGGHALAQLLIENKIEDWKNDYLIYVAVDSLIELEMIMKRLSKHNIPFSYFAEPDFDFTITAVAVESTDIPFLKKLPLLMIEESDVVKRKSVFSTESVREQLKRVKTKMKLH